MKIDLIRHGEPVGGRMYRGQLDDPLSKKGWSEMHRATAAGNWDLIVTSPLKRCSEFAEDLVNRQKINLIIENAFMEIGMGVWEGRSIEEIQQESPRNYSGFFQDPVHCRPEGGEPLDRFFNRVITGWDSIIATRKEKNILVVAHAGVLRAIVCHLLDCPIESMYRMRFATASIVHVSLIPDTPAMIEFPS
ncbi:MAG: histidine phosphatase family protein [Gammaproteobacteria bacterium]|nr:MAG: histidine phosphatase family protein [Gammaproteobacteria bacterium]